MKESNLGKFYVEVLGLAPNSEDARRLLNWRRGTETTQGGDFGNAIGLVLRTRCVPRGDLTVRQVNDALDQLNVAMERREKTRTLTYLLRHSSAQEQKWLVRIILKELKTGVSEKTVFATFHPHAIDYFNVTSNLRKVCETLADPAFRYEAVQQIQLFNAIKPMLASNKTPTEALPLMAGHGFVIETKFDGERLQVHKQGNEVRMWTRRANEYTQVYAKMQPVLRECVRADCILDGEIIVWDTVRKAFEGFGRLKTLAKWNGDGGVDNESYGKQFCYMVFDILYLNDQPVVALPLSQRLQLLRRVVKVRDKEVELVEQRPGKTLAHIVDALDKAILERQEGIMVKSLDSPYVPNERKNAWLKIKPEYAGSVGDDLDLVILGGFYGTGQGRRGGTISHFLVGVAVLHGPDAGKYYTLAKVGSGYNDNTLLDIQHLFKDAWRNFDRERPPPDILFAPGSNKDKPDVWLAPAHSRIVQVRASQIHESDKYRAGWTLRFPRVYKFRMDKAPNECLDLDSLVELARAAEGRYAKRPLPNGDAQPAKKRKVPKRRPVVPLYRPVEASTVAATSHCLDGLDFWVLSGDETSSKAELERMVLELGGGTTQAVNKTEGAASVVAIAGRATVRVKAVMQARTIDVVRPEWLRRCRAAAARLPFDRELMLAVRPATDQKLLLETDRWGDSYFENTDVASLRNVLARVVLPEHWAPGELPAVAAQEQEAAEHGLPPLRTSMLRGCVVYVDRWAGIGEGPARLAWQLEQAEALLRFYGAEVAGDLSGYVSHVVMEPGVRAHMAHFRAAVRARLAAGRALLLVSPAWVFASARLHENLDEGPFLIDLD